ncbi:MAG: ribonuclease HI [Deltaproteobacteria bacterium]|nr:ribonuclease HI [Deltaproteobacteria bacterium]
MNFKKMVFKGKQVFVEVDENGGIVESGGRANMKYRLEDDRMYSPSVKNLTLPDQGQSSLFQSTTPASPVQKSTSMAQKSTAAKPKAQADTIVAYTDGGCIGNPGPSGLGYVVRYPDNTVVKKGEPLGEGTNNIAELNAIFRVLQLVKDKSAPLHIHTDSSYAIGVLTKGWKAKANQQLIAQIRTALAQFTNVDLIKVKGHAGNPDNELVDQLANTAARTQKIQ